MSSDSWETLTARMFSVSQHVVKQHYRPMMCLDLLHTQAAHTRQNIVIKDSKVMSFCF